MREGAYNVLTFVLACIAVVTLLLGFGVLNG